MREKSSAHSYCSRRRRRARKSRTETVSGLVSGARAMSACGNRSLESI